jgi:hypothetical protein
VAGEKAGKGGIELFDGGGEHLTRAGDPGAHLVLG